MPALKLLGEMLVESGVITSEQLEIGLKQQKRTGEKLGEILVRLGFVTRSDVLKVMSEQSGSDFIDLKLTHIDNKAIDLVPGEIAREFTIIPVGLNNGSMVVATENPYNLNAVDRIRKLTGLDIELRVSDADSILKAIDTHYGIAYSPEQVIEKSIHEALSVKQIEEGTPPIIRLVEAVIARGVKNGATDIHFEPDERVARVRYRIDGILHMAPALPKKIYKAVVSRIKVMSSMDITDQRIPQDGGFTFSFGQSEMDIRVSSLPAMHGESMVLRLLDKSAALLELDQLGFTGDNLDNFRLLLNKPYGMIVITGPTGSGKSTTLYAALTILNALEKNIITVEDPVERRMPLIKQSQVNEKAGYTFAQALRHILRHDPDIILIGEMRDKETAEIGVRAALTGHLVFTTLHANTAADAIPRLVDIGIDPYLLSSTILATMSQRLVRRVCPNCQEEYRPNPEFLKHFGIENVMDAKHLRGKGCEQCNFTGYRGRMGVFELLRITPELSQLIANGATATELLKTSKIHTMHEDALEKALTGITTLKEVIRVVG
jgi:type II secretory ATPase GspE/PulE/Tfp pilus assembly ATPase PilB-like protein